MKKTIATAAGLIATLSLALPAFAQTTVNPCPTGNFGAVCNLQANKFGAIVGLIIQTLFVPAVIIAVIFLVCGGIKWIMSGGDKAKVESARNTIIAGVIGLVLTFLAYFLIGLVAGMFGVDIKTLTLPSITNLV